MNNTKKQRPPFKQKKRGNNKNFASTLDPQKLIKKSSDVVEETHTPAWSYASTSLHDDLKANLERRGYTHPTPIQEQCLDAGLSGRDIMGIASTGTGKTAAFLIPIVHQMLTKKENVQSLIVVPTRELAIQVEEEFRLLTQRLNLTSACFIGGRSTDSDIKKLRNKFDVIIGTPGRLLDLYNQRALKLHTITTFVLDEFDRMLDMGFLQDIKKILGGLKNRKQTLFFSATVDPAQKNLINEILHDPVKVMIQPKIAASDRVDQELIKVQNGENKFDKLLHLISDDSFHKVLIFAETKRIVNQVSKQLVKSGIKSDMIHGNKSQNYRQNALKQFSAGKVQVLVATDVAARGLDVSDVSHVINYQMPRTMDSYIHRVGRTGRAGKTGQAYTFVD